MAFERARMDKRSQNTWIDLVDGKFSQSTRKQLTSFFDELRAGSADRLVIHFHGGLISREEARKKARALSPIFRRTGTTPLFVIWNTDLGTTLRNNLAQIAGEAIFWTLISRIRSLVEWAGAPSPTSSPGARGINGRSAIRFVPNETPDQIRANTQNSAQRVAPRTLSRREEALMEEAVRRDHSLRARVREIAPRKEGARGGRAGKGATTLLSPEVLEGVCNEGRHASRSGALSVFLTGRIIATVRAVLSRYRSNTHHGLYTTIVEEVLRAFYLANVGRATWDGMKRNAGKAFGEESACGGAALMSELLAWQTKGKKVTLVGHSAGSIFILNLLRHIHSAATDFRCDVVLLAPACTFREFHESLSRLRACVRRIRVFNLSDELESGYWEVRYLYNASLLYFVSGVLESRADTPLVGMQRYYSGNSPYDKAQLRAVVAYLRKGVIWSPSSSPPQRLCNARTHGGFDREPQTLKSLFHILQNGPA
jgi:hypothetical protein